MLYLGVTGDTFSYGWRGTGLSLSNFLKTFRSLNEFVGVWKKMMFSSDSIVWRAAI